MADSKAVSVYPSARTGEGAAPVRTRGGDLWRRLTRNELAVAGGLILAVVAFAAVFAPYLSPEDPLEMNPTQLLQPPSADHWMGTDEFGRDILSRVIWGARISLYVGAISVTIAVLAGVSLGLVAGYFGGLVDDLIARVLDVVFAFPTILLALGIVGMLGPSLTNTMVAIGIVYTPVYARLARGTTLAVKERDFVEAAIVSGASSARIIGRHILPNVAAPLIVQTSLSLSLAILAEASLSFLGLGTQPPDPSWGTMVNTGQRLIELSPWPVVFPGLAIVLAVLAFNLIGDGLRDALDPRLRA
ncbi:MAG TPA: ABC transporter permease [Chloroflexota bacterium]|nr:ABC transporter permease [Chloroflexota bacterium]